jgi:hypothetical protein
MVIIFQSPKRLISFGAIAIGLVLVITLISQINFFSTGIDAFNARFTDANESEGGLEKGVFWNRMLKQPLDYLKSSATGPFWGGGLGKSSSVAGYLLPHEIIPLGKPEILVGENEWIKLTGELGFSLGMVMILIRIYLAIKIMKIAFLRTLGNDYLPWLLMSFGVVNIIFGMIEQPTNLGFITLSTGMILASFK